MLEPKNETLREIADLRRSYIRDRLVFIPGVELVRLVKGLGATEADVAGLAGYADRLEKDPTLSFRQSRQGRFAFDSGDREIYRAAFKPFVLSTEEAFVRHDSGVVREFAELESDYQQNSAFQALLLFKALMVDGVTVQPRPRLDYGAERSVCTAFLLRTITRPDEVGEPALEGSHSDGVDHTMTTLLGARNMSSNSAKTFVIDPGAAAGERWSELDPKRILGVHQHLEYLDTLLFADYERKHAVSPVYAIDTDSIATRDMCIFFTRKPVSERHVSYQYDGLERHQEAPVQITLPATGWFAT